MKKRYIVLGVLLLSILLLGSFYQSHLKDQWHVWDSGIRFMHGLSNTKYTLENSEIDSTYSVELDLADLESNTGKRVYKKAGNTIKIESLIHDEESGEYLITLRSKGTYNVFQGKLVTFYAYQPRTKEGVRLPSIETASASVNYMGADYSCVSLGGMQLVQMDGDTCTYQVILPNGDDTAAVFTISGLTENKWTRNWNYRESE